MKIQPLNSNLLIEIKKEEVTKSGILLAKEVHLDEATVIAVAPDVEGVEEGDIILFKEYSTDDVLIDGKTVSFIKVENVLGIKK